MASKARSKDRAEQLAKQRTVNFVTDTNKAYGCYLVSASPWTASSAAALLPTDFGAVCLNVNQSDAHAKALQ
eukprot:3085321-Rhodomonas_salina.1